MSDVILDIQNTGKTFFGVPALKDINIGVQRGRLLGLIGQNGAGKSTLMNIIGGVVAPDAGSSMTLDGQPYAPRNPSDAKESGIAFIHQELNLFTNLSIAENIFIDNFPTLGGSNLIRFIDRRTLRNRTRELLDSLNLDLSPDTLIDDISPGQRQMVEIVKALNLDAKIIIFDEPTTSLTARETEQLFEIIGQLREQGVTMIYISHILGDVLQIADDIAVLRDGNLIGTGPREEFDINKMIAMMIGRDLEQLYPPKTNTPSDEVVMQVENISMTGIVKDINLTLHRGEVLGLFGLMGSGRSELARIIFGLDEFEMGAIHINGKALDKLSPGHSIHQGMAFVTENRREEGLMMEANIADNIGLVSLPAYAQTPVRLLDGSRLLVDAREVASLLQIKSGPIESHSAKSLSGGNQQKVVISKWLMSNPVIFIMDEPTRGVDVGAKYEIYSIINNLAAQGNSVLFISSELDELTGMCDRIVVMGQGEISGEFSREQFNDEDILRAAFREGNGVS